MDIQFDLFIDHPEYIDIVSEEEDIFYNELHTFIVERLSVLKEQIDKEEADAAQNGGIAFTCIYILRPKTSIRFIGYSDPLKDKMLGCFSESDFAYIFQKIEMLIKARGN